MRYVPRFLREAALLAALALAAVPAGCAAPPEQPMAEGRRIYQGPPGRQIMAYADVVADLNNRGPPDDVVIALRRRDGDKDGMYGVSAYMDQTTMFMNGGRVHPVGAGIPVATVEGLTGLKAGGGRIVLEFEDGGEKGTRVFRYNPDGTFDEER